MTDQTPIQVEAQAVHATIAAALAAAQMEMGSAKKTADNPHFKRKYADLDAVCDAAMPALNRHGIAIVQPMERVGEEWVLFTRFIHGQSGEILETPVPLIVGKRDMQGLGSAMTYARRYGLMTLAGIAPEDDDGNAAVESTRNRSREPETPKFNARAASDRIVTGVNRAATVEALGEFWASERETLKDIRAADPAAFNDALKAKDARKAALTPPAGNDLGDDSIPF